MRILGTCALALVACGGGNPGFGDDDDTGPAPDAPPEPDAPMLVDDDGDGLDDTFELDVANAYLPFLSLDPNDGCRLSGLLVRVRPHPADPTKLSIIYDHLFETDCGLNGHIGDNEAFGIAIDPTLPAPDGILAIKTASHQNTPCQRITECTTCSGDARRACERAASDNFPILYASKDKHGQYATKGQCGFGTCFDTCTLATTAHRPPIVNAGEPGKPLTSNLTTNGFINPANGWSKPEVMNVDPWGPGDFGSAGNIAGDLQDATFEPAPCS